MAPSPEWYEPVDLPDTDPDDAPYWPSEALTASQGVVWWTAAPILDTDD